MGCRTAILNVVANDNELETSEDCGDERPICPEPDSDDPNAKNMFGVFDVVSVRIRF